MTISCLFEAAPALYEKVEEQLLETNDSSRLFELFVEFHSYVDESQQDFDSPEDWPWSEEERERAKKLHQRRQSLVRGWIDGQAPPLRDLLLAITTHAVEVPPFSEEAIDVLRTLKPRSEIATVKKLELCMCAGEVVEEELRDFLNQASTAMFAEIAVEIALQAGYWSIVEAALSHRFAKAQAAAIAAVAARDPASLTSEILALRESNSKYVKAALLKEISAHPLPQYLNAVVAMTDDRWLGDEPYNTICYPFARIRTSIPA